MKSLIGHEYDLVSLTEELIKLYGDEESLTNFDAILADKAIHFSVLPKEPCENTTYASIHFEIIERHKDFLDGRPNVDIMITSVNTRN